MTSSGIFTGKPGHHPTLVVMDFLHKGVKKKHFKRAAQYLQEEMNTNPYSIQPLDSSKLIITDQEQALVNGLKEGFHSTTSGPPIYMLCVIHLQNNVKDFLIKHENQTTANRICNIIFGKKGIVEAKGQQEFDDRFLEFSKDYGEYFDERRLKKLEEQLWNNVVLPSITFPHIKHINTNRPESENARLKSLTEHKGMPIDKITMVCENKQQAQVSFWS